MRIDFFVSFGNKLHKYYKIELNIMNKNGLNMNYYD